MTRPSALKPATSAAAHATGGTLAGRESPAEPPTGRLRAKTATLPTGSSPEGSSLPTDRRAEPKDDDDGIHDEPTDATRPDSARDEPADDEPSEDQLATLPEGTALAQIKPAGSFASPQARKEPLARPETTARATPFPDETATRTVAAPAARKATPSTAEQLRGEDEDGPTLIAHYPSAGRDPEATELMPSTGAAPTPYARGVVVGPSTTAISDAPSPHVAEEAFPTGGVVMPVSEHPPPLHTAPIPPKHPIHAQLAEREAAVQAALMAAQGLGLDPARRAEERARYIEVITVAVMGSAALLAATVSLFTTPAASRLNVPLAMALFLAGLTTIQKREPIRLALLALSAALLLGALIGLLVLA